MQTDDIRDDVREVLFTEQQLRERLAEIAREIEAEYADEPPLLVGVLKGAVVVVSDLARELRLPVHMDWMAVSSYGSGTTSSGVVRILKDLDADITGRRVLIVEDIIDSGLTLSWLKANLESRGPASVDICTLFRKPARLKSDIELKFVGFDVPDEFVVGYGLDYDERYRNLRDLVVLQPHVYAPAEA
ncbi:hypoxanthine phosphoribosyltransferase [Pseudoclavibacter endophyticus]|uniref:Hypoxanthine phosphoribosyltransferase n=1 Tax=Pseudoclavibacter endophyticus TaxID=1778590 RepID=A0A6H9WC61_9MICO|nr:hypoxanthine phosphoribosyltransferase [Pseudoclavibacter endophyticus]KAB1648263.1 hypoxanthine phosphoribosyltransferase [Pseudoclavibacter endophyticus]